MAFNSYTYNANKDERQSREYLERARQEKRDGETYPGRVEHLVKMARSLAPSARGWRDLRNLQREAR